MPPAKRIRFLMTDPARSPTPFVLPVNPTKVDVERSAKMLSFAVQDLGDVVLPRGTQPRRMSWESVFTDRPRWGSVWEDPERRRPDFWDDLFNTWMEEGTRIELLVTFTPFTIRNYYVESYRATASGGHGDIHYAVAWVEARTLLIPVSPPSIPSFSVVELGEPEEVLIPGSLSLGASPLATDQIVAELTEWGIDTEGHSESTVRTLHTQEKTRRQREVQEHDTTSQEAPDQRSEPERPKTYTVQAGDYLIKISQQIYDTDTRADDIWRANITPNGPMGQDKNFLQVGWVLTLPE